MIRIAIVILNWNGVGFLRRFLPSVISNSPGEDITILVADNGSTDDSVKFLKECFPKVGVLEFERNFGFAGGYNKAFAELEAEYFLLVNSDIEVTQGWLEPLIDTMESDNHIAACMPKIRDINRRNYFEYAGAAGGFIDFLGYPFCRGRVFSFIERDRGQYDDKREIFWASGACMMVRSSHWQKFGGFDESFFAHMEEIDLCWRMKNAGKKIMVCPSSVVYHLGGGTLPQYHPRKTFLNYRNSLSMLLKNLPPERLYLIILRLMLDWLPVIKFMTSLSFTNAFSIIKAHFAFFYLAPLYLKQRNNCNELSKGLRHQEIYPKSIVVSFFIKQRKFFSSFF